MNTKRICELEIGDKFLYDGLENLVFNIKEGRVLFKTKKGTDLKSIGQKSRMFVEFTGKGLVPINIYLEIIELLADYRTMDEIANALNLKNAQAGRYISLLSRRYLIDRINNDGPNKKYKIISIKK